MTTQYGLTGSGFNLKRLINIMTDIQDRLNIILIDTDGEVASGIGQLIQPFALNLSEAWEALHDMYRNQDPDNAEGVHLDLVLALSLLERLGALQSTVNIGIHHVDNVNPTPGYILPSDFIVESNADSERFVPVVESTLVNTGISRMDFRILELLGANTYGVLINDDVGQLYTATYTGTETLEEILDSIVEAINDAPYTYQATSLPNEQGFVVFDTSGVFDILPYDALTKMYYPVLFKAVNTGDINTFAGTLVDIVTPKAEISEVYNLQDGTPGRTVENDGEARIRRKVERNTSGGGSISGIIAYLRKQVPEIVTLSGEENKTDTEVDGIPPHEIRITVTGGDLQEIGQALYVATAGGINTVGNTPITIKDDNGDDLIIWIVRPEITYGWIRVDILTLDTEETLPTSYIQDIKDKCIEIGKTFDTGKDVYGQTFVPAPITVPGIAEVLITVAGTVEITDIPVYSNKVVIASSFVAVFDEDRIVVINNL